MNNHGWNEALDLAIEAVEREIYDIDDGSGMITCDLVSIGKKMVKALRDMKDERTPSVIIYTDGACSGNPGPGGWAYVICYEYPKRSWFDSGEHTGETTNQQMEIAAAIAALSRLGEPHEVKLHSDSEYLIKTMNHKSRRRTNLDWWVELDEKAKPHKITWIHTKAGSHELQIECDKLAKDSAQIAKRTLEKRKELAQRGINNYKV
jgi:ribonuclease HI